MKKIVVCMLVCIMFLCGCAGNITDGVALLEQEKYEEAKEVFAIAGENAMNCIVETENGCVCTIELGATLSEGERDIDKHEIITDNGVGCDRVVDTQMPQDSIYVFGQEKKTYMDTDAELYGYSEIEINTVRNAFAVAKCEELQKSNTEKWSHIQKVVACAKQSLESMENVKVEA